MSLTTIRARRDASVTLAHTAVCPDGEHDTYIDRWGEHCTICHTTIHTYSHEELVEAGVYPA